MKKPWLYSSELVQIPAISAKLSAKTNPKSRIANPQKTKTEFAGVGDDEVVSFIESIVEYSGWVRKSSARNLKI